jgi:hypothetical protein
MSETKEAMIARHAKEVAAMERNQRLESGEATTADLKWAMKEHERKWDAERKRLEAEIKRLNNHTCSGGE